MEDKQIPAERQLAIYKEFYQEELRKREEAEKGIKDLEKLLADYQDMLYKESVRRLKELDEEKEKWLRKMDDEKSKSSEQCEKAMRSAEVRMLNFFVQTMACTSIIPILSKFYGCSWSTFFKELFILPPSLVAFIILLEFVGSKLRKLHQSK